MATDQVTGDTLSQQELVDIGVQNTVMAIREQLMAYYKGYYGQSVIGETNVWLESIEPRRRRHAEQHEASLRNLTWLKIADYSLATLSQRPMTITLHLSNLDRSRTMRAVKAGIEQFLERYMRSITVQTDNYGARSDWRGDRQLVQKTKLREPQPTADQYAQTVDYDRMIQQLMEDPSIIPSHRSFIFPNYTPNYTASWPTDSDDD